MEIVKYFLFIKNMIGCGGRIWTCDLQVMSLTSYRTAPPRVNSINKWTVKTFLFSLSRLTPLRASCPPRVNGCLIHRLTGVCQRLIKPQKPNGAPDIGLGAPQAIIMNRFLNAPNFVFFGLFCGADPLWRPGSDLLSHALRRSTIGAKGFHGRVRDGIGWSTLAKTTRSSKRISHCEV